MNEKDERPLLQRRGGRRISMPSSPISPSLTKRSDRAFRTSESFNTADALATATASSGNPSWDLPFPSPIVNGPSFAPHVTGDAGRNLSSVHTVTTQETERSEMFEYVDHSPGPLTGPLVTSRGAETRPQQQQSLRPTYLTEINTKSSPILGRWSESRDRTFETTVSAGRNYSTTSLSTDRSASDENVSAKAPVTKKSRLNLLNPMSLLARRRASQNAKVEEMNVNVKPFHVPAIPEDFEPSIRGKFVHDFSTPRNKRSHLDYSPRREAFSSPTHVRRQSDLGPPSIPQHGSSPSPVLHSPMFKEHFQEEESALQPGQTAYLHNIANSRNLFEVPSPSSLPSFAQKLPAIIPEPEKVREQAASPVLNIPHPDAPPPPPPPLSKSSPSPKATPSPKRTPSPSPSPSQSPYLDVPPEGTLPKHMASVSSRFSFQIAGQASSAQEKLLEERHKEHLAKDSRNLTNPDDPVDHGYDDYDFDADDDFEEKIPGINTDLDEDDGFYSGDIPIRNIHVQSSQQPIRASRQSLQGFHFTPTLAGFSPTSTNHASEPTPRDVEGFAIGIADTKDSPIDPTSGYGHAKPVDGTIPSIFFEGLQISTVEEDKASAQAIGPDHQDALQQAFNDVDLYFDDGEFDMDVVDPDHHFDENLLDDETGQIRDIPAENAKRYEAALERGTSGDRVTALNPNIGLSRDTSSSSNFVDIRGGDSSGYSDNGDYSYNPATLKQTCVLTEDNLAAYHDALAEAATYAAANGKFNRQVSFRSDPSDDVEQIPTRDGRTHLTSQGSMSQPDADLEYVDDYGAFPFDDNDDGIDDDGMIAEANAEALENDDDGFYGQEFGFYARTHGKDNLECINGGFFTARGSNGIKRSHSGKANFQEPSLTPITEKSEWSARNSVASLQFYGGFPQSAQSMQSPGLNQLLDSPSFEDEMSLSALIKLRRGAWGGSSTSINSLGERSMPGSSPLANVSSYSFPPPETSALSKQLHRASSSVMESEADEDEWDAGQPTLTQNTPRKKTTGVIPSTPHGPMAYLAVTESPNAKKKGHHRRSSSGADSVSYVRDADGRWVMERRRTGEDEQEIVEREYLDGTTI